MVNWWSVLGAAVPAVVSGQAWRMMNRRAEEQRLRSARKKDEDSEHEDSTVKDEDSPEAFTVIEGVYMFRGQLCTKTKSIVPGENECFFDLPNEDGTGSESFSIWDPSTSDLAAAILKGGIDNIWIVPGAKVLYLGPQSFTTVSHVADIVGTSGRVYVIADKVPDEFVEMMSSEHDNITSVSNINYPDMYTSYIGTVDVILCELPMPFRHDLLAVHAQRHLRDGGHFVVSLKENLKNDLLESLIPEHLKSFIDSDFGRPERELGIGVQFQCLVQEGFKPSQHACLEKTHYYFVGEYRGSPELSYIDC